MKTVCFLFLCLAGVVPAFAGSATWDANPTSSDWNTAANWTPQSIPSSETDVATFGASNTTNITCGDSPDGVYASTVVGDIVFDEGASSYTITMTPVYDVVFPSLISIYGQGIINHSGKVQTLIAAHSGNTKESGRVYFNQSASAGENVVVINEGGASSTGDGMYGGFTQFWDSSTAGAATFISNGGVVAGAGGGACSLLFSSNAESATFISNPGEVSGAGAAYTLLQTSGNLGNSTFVGNPATVTGAEGGWVEIDYGTCAGAHFIANGSKVAGPQAGQIYVYGGDGYATFTAFGGQGNGAEGGLVDLFNSPPTADTHVVAEAGGNGGLGGTILIEYRAVVDEPQFEVYGNGTLDLIKASSRIVTIGSLAGDGLVLLDRHTLNIGQNNLSTLFSGSIQQSGSLGKVGSGTLTLAEANLFSGATTVSAGTLLVSNPVGSATGRGLVQVNAGTLGGDGIIAGPVDVGTGSGSGAFVAPAGGAKKQATLTIQSPLTLNSDATYTCTFKARRNQALVDAVVAHGVRINSGASFAFSGQAQGPLQAGLALTVISNTATTPIAGTFANLPDGAILTINANNFQASYEGGDGNDLTLTVVQ